VKVEVVSLDWKWLFIYPEYGIASVNELAFPANVPVNFKITSDTAMNSFFIPQLGSQIYSMAGMATKLHLIANEPGTFEGISANYSGAGFAGMKFNAIATANADDFDAWVAKVKQQGTTLDVEQYKQLAEKSENNPVQYYGSVQKGMFNYIVMQYMHPDSNMKPMDSMEGMHDMSNMESMSGMDHTKHMQNMEHMVDKDAENSGLSSPSHSTTEHSSTASGEAK
jgi:cytochrome o ubiquinol oxidase subunit 2